MGINVLVGPGRLKKKVQRTFERNKKSTKQRFRAHGGCTKAKEGRKEIRELDRVLRRQIWDLEKKLKCSCLSGDRPRRIKEMFGRWVAQKNFCKTSKKNGVTAVGPTGEEKNTSGKLCKLKHRT